MLSSIPYPYGKYETGALRRVVYCSIKTGNRKKQLAWLCTKVTEDCSHLFILKEQWPIGKRQHSTDQWGNLIIQ